MQIQARVSSQRLFIVALCSSLSLGACADQAEPYDEHGELRIIDGSLTEEWLALGWAWVNTSALLR